jgi:hypothetical protein
VYSLLDIPVKRSKFVILLSNTNTHPHMNATAQAIRTEIEAAEPVAATFTQAEILAAVLYDLKNVTTDEQLAECINQACYAVQSVYAANGRYEQASAAVRRLRALPTTLPVVQDEPTPTPPNSHQAMNTVATTTAPVTEVVFRAFPNGDVIALFPYVIHSGYLVESYMHTGQHSGAAIDIVSSTRPAKPEELAPLMQELASEYGYNLAPIKRINYAKFRAAYAAARKY